MEALPGDFKGMGANGLFLVFAVAGKELPG